MDALAKGTEAYLKETRTAEEGRSETHKESWCASHDDSKDCVGNGHQWSDTFEDVVAMSLPEPY